MQRIVKCLLACLSLDKLETVHPFIVPACSQETLEFKSTIIYYFTYYLPIASLFLLLSSRAYCLDMIGRVRQSHPLTHPSLPLVITMYVRKDILSLVILRSWRGIG
jgi:hypothetical protein